MKDEPIKFRVFYTLAAFTGFRRGELLGLEWKDINFYRNEISVSRTSLYDERVGMYTDSPKTKKSVRTIKVSDGIIDLLKDYKIQQHQMFENKKMRIYETDRLFTTVRGLPMGSSTPLNWYKSFCERNNVRFLCTHSFRHFAASVMIDSGMDVVKVSATLGHSTPSTTLNIYSHEFNKAKEEACAAMSNALRI